MCLVRRNYWEFPRGSAGAAAIGLGGAVPVNIALDRAANVIRAGDCSNLLTVLGSAAVLGFLLTRESRRESLYAKCPPSAH